MNDGLKSMSCSASLAGWTKEHWRVYQVLCIKRQEELRDLYLLADLAGRYNDLFEAELEWQMTTQKLIVLLIDLGIVVRKSSRGYFYGWDEKLMEFLREELLGKEG
jgi:hypothetical protein